MAKCGWCKQGKAGTSGYCEICLPIVKKHRKNAFVNLNELEELSKDTTQENLSEFAEQAVAIMDDLNARGIPYDTKEKHAQLSRIFANCASNLPNRYRKFWDKTFEPVEQTPTQKSASFPVPVPIYPNQGPIASANSIKLEQLEVKKAKQELKDLKTQARCPKCGSPSLSGHKKGFGIGKAILGAATPAGAFGLMAGNIGAKKVRVTCLNCGKQFWA